MFAFKHPLAYECDKMVCIPTDNHVHACSGLFHCTFVNLMCSNHAQELFQGFTCSCSYA